MFRPCAFPFGRDFGIGDFFLQCEQGGAAFAVVAAALRFDLRQCCRVDAEFVHHGAVVGEGDAESVGDVAACDMGADMAEVGGFAAAVAAVFTAQVGKRPQAVIGSVGLRQGEVV